MLKLLNSIKKNRIAYDEHIKATFLIASSNLKLMTKYATIHKQKLSPIIKLSTCLVELHFGLFQMIIILVIGCKDRKCKSNLLKIEIGLLLFYYSTILQF